MNEEQKKLKIEKLEKYSEVWKDEKNRAELFTAVGTLSLMAILGGIKSIIEAFNIPSQHVTDWISGTSEILTASGIAFSYISFKMVIDSMSKKINIQNKIDELNAEIDEYENKNARGGRK